MQYTMSLKLKNNGKAFFGPGPARLLMLVDEGESLHQAAATIGMAYSKAWRIIREAEKELGFPLLDRRRGGIGGGGSALTPEARTLLIKYNQFQTEMVRLGDHLFDECFASRATCDDCT